MADDILPIKLEGTILEKLSALSQKLGWNQHLIVAKAIELMWQEEENGGYEGRAENTLNGDPDRVRELEDKIAKLESILKKHGVEIDSD